MATEKVKTIGLIVLTLLAALILILLFLGDKASFTQLAIIIIPLIVTALTAGNRLGSSGNQDLHRGRDSEIERNEVNRG